MSAPGCLSTVFYIVENGRTPYPVITMHTKRKTPKLPFSLLQRWQRFVQTHIWKMEIHSSAWIATTAYIDRTWPRGVHVGAYCIIDHQAILLTHDMTRGLYLDTVIGEGTNIGPRAIVMPGVKIGKNCIIAPGSVVSRDLPDGAHVMGSPARPLH